MTMFYCLVIFYTVSIYAFAPICPSSWFYYQSVHQNTSVNYVLHMEENFYGLSIRTSRAHYLIFAIPMPLKSYVSAYVLIVRIDKRLLGVRAIATLHQQVLLFANLLERIVSPIMLTQIILCVLMSSSTMVYFAVAVSRTTQNRAETIIMNLRVHFRTSVDM